MFLDINLIFIFLCAYCRSFLKLEGLLVLVNIKWEKYWSKYKIYVMSLEIVKEEILKGMLDNV